MSQPIVVASNVSHTFGSGAAATTVLREIDLDVHAGDVLLLAGPSGSGKTTLLHVLGCLLSPSSGTVTLAGRSTKDLSEEQLAALRLSHFGFVFQAYNLFPVLTATENVMVTLDLLKVPKRESRRRSRELLKMVGLKDRLDAYPAELSGGQKQRVAIARALASEPKVLMADEPTAALDAENGLRAMELFRILAHQQQRAVVIVTHDPRIFHLSDRIVHLEDGRITGRRSGPDSTNGVA
jgi:putative ABC transport system ATP-binding protein